MKVLFLSQEVSPYTGETELAQSVIENAKRLSSKGHEVRIFLPKYKCVKDRKHQLHEVIRLSGLNIDINGVSQPITLKVTTIPKEKIQIYFIENDDYFKRDGLVYNENGEMYEDANERSLLFCKASLDIVKRLNWSPDTIVNQGWMSYLSIPFLKDYYKNDETFEGSKLTLNHFQEDDFGEFMKSNTKDLLVSEGISEEFASLYQKNTHRELFENIVLHSDFIIEKDKYISGEYNQIPSNNFLDKEEFTIEQLLKN